MRKQNIAAQFSITREQVKEMIAVSSKRDGALICLMGLSGLRRAEAVTMRYSYIDQDKRRLSFPGKGLKQRTVPIDVFSARILFHYTATNYPGKKFETQKTGEYYLFPSRNSATGVLNLNNVNRIVARAGKSAGLTNPDPDKKFINPHILRHSYAHYLKLNNVPLEVIQDLLGHSSIQTTANSYGRRSIDEIQEILKTVEI